MCLGTQHVNSHAFWGFCEAQHQKESLVCLLAKTLSTACCCEEVTTARGSLGRAGLSIAGNAMTDLRLGIPIASQLPHNWQDFGGRQLSRQTFSQPAGLSSRLVNCANPSTPLPMPLRPKARLTPLLFPEHLHLASRIHKSEPGGWRPPLKVYLGSASTKSLIHSSIS